MMHVAETRTLAAVDYVVAAVLAVVVLVGASFRMVPGVVGVVDDDAVYAVTAQALAEGDGYRLINLPGAPPQTKYPVLYPGLISLAWPLGSTREESIFAMQCATAAMGAIGLALAYLYCVRFAVSSRSAARVSCLLLAVAPGFLFYCSQTMSEMLFLALLVVALWAAESRLRATDRSAARDFACGLLLGLPILARSVGVLLPIAPLALLWRAGRPVHWIVAGIVTVATPWFLWTKLAAVNPADGVIAYQTAYTGWGLSYASLAAPFLNIAMGFKAFAHIELEMFSRWLYGQTDSARWILFAIGALPWAAVLWRVRTLAILPATLVVYFGLLCLWPWPPDRFLVPILPFLGAMLISHIASVATALVGARIAQGATMLLVIAVFVANGMMLERYSAASSSAGFPYFVLVETPVSWQHYTRAFDWLREHTEPGEVIASAYDPMTALYTGRPAIRPFEMNPAALYYGDPASAVGTLDEFRATLARHRARYLLLTPMPAYPMEEPVYVLVNTAFDEMPGLLKPVWQAQDDMRFVIFEVHADEAAP